MRYNLYKLGSFQFEEIVKALLGGGDGACIRVFVRIDNLLNIKRLHHANKFL